MLKRSEIRRLNTLVGDAPMRFVDVAEQKAEAARLQRFADAGGHDGPAFALSPGMAEFDLSDLQSDVAEFASDLVQLSNTTPSDQTYFVGNGYFGLSDATALYLMVRRHQPRRIIEVGCGNSTRVSRAAINDGGFECTLTAIDPYPRADIAGLVDGFKQSTVEALDTTIFEELEAGDILFIDSSHQVRVANDVTYLFCRILPLLKPGVVIHVHDVFLPFEYLDRFFTDCPSWGEQYILHAVMQGGGYEILWPGYYLQRTRAADLEPLAGLGADRAQSFWMVKK